LGGLALSATVVFDHPTVDALALHLASTLFHEPAAVPPQKDAVLVDGSTTLEQLGADELLELMDMKATRLLGKADNS
jgi:hypothetical protein